MDHPQKQDIITEARIIIEALNKVEPKKMPKSIEKKIWATLYKFINNKNNDS
jgi:hypothetical protein